MATASKSNVILFSGGCFNPPTNMHLRIFEIAKDFLNRNTLLNVIGGVISPTHDKYKKASLAEANATHRSEMVKLAIQNNDFVKLSMMEIQDSDWIRTRKVLDIHQDHLLKVLKGEINSQEWVPDISQLNSPCRLILLCGGDLIESFSIPGLWEEDDIETIVKDYGLVVISREGCNPENFIYKSDLLTKYRNNIFLVTEWITNDISSTKIRRAIRRNESIKYLLPDPVIEYIKTHKLYSRQTEYSECLHENNESNPCNLQSLSLTKEIATSISSPEPQYSSTSPSFNSDQENSILNQDDVANISPDSNPTIPEEELPEDPQPNNEETTTTNNFSEVPINNEINNTKIINPSSSSSSSSSEEDEQEQLMKMPERVYIHDSTIIEEEEEEEEEEDHSSTTTESIKLKNQISEKEDSIQHIQAVIDEDVSIYKEDTDIQFQEPITYIDSPELETKTAIESILSQENSMSETQDLPTPPPPLEEEEDDSCHATLVSISSSLNEPSAIIGKEVLSQIAPEQEQENISSTQTNEELEAEEEEESIESSTEEEISTEIGEKIMGVESSTPTLPSPNEILMEEGGSSSKEGQPKLEDEDSGAETEDEVATNEENFVVIDQKPSEDFVSIGVDDVKKTSSSSNTSSLASSKKEDKVQIEITKKGIRVISEKESFL